MFKQKLTFKNSRNLKLSAIFEGEDKNAPVVVRCHGFASSKDSISNKDFAQKLVERGLSIFRFDFTGHGQSEGKISEITPIRALDDLKSAISFIGLKEFGLYGSSFGGFVSLLYASENSILALALKAPVSNYFEVAKFTPNSRQWDIFLTEIEDIDLYDKAKNIKAPTLIVHGDRDDVVPISQSQKLLKALGGQKRLEIIKGAGHDISGEDLEETITLIANFFVKTLLP